MTKGEVYESRLKEYIKLVNSQDFSEEKQNDLMTELDTLWLSLSDEEQAKIDEKIECGWNKFVEENV